MILGTQFKIRGAAVGEGEDVAGLELEGEKYFVFTGHAAKRDYVGHIALDEKKWDRVNF